MRSLIFALALVWPLVTAAVNTYVAPPPPNGIGSDANDCLTAITPCATPQRAADVAGGGVGTQTGGGLVKIADGTYYATTRVLYYRFMAFEGNCQNPENVNIVAPSNQAAFTIEDLAIVSLKCMRLSSSGSNSKGVVTRQYTILDYELIDFNSMPGGIHISLGEKSKGNCLGGIRIVGPAAYHAAVGAQSYLTLNCNILLYGTPTFDAFIWMVWQSLVLVNQATFNGGAAGRPYINDSSLLVKEATVIPGDQPPIVQNGGAVQ
jgi:hypothetical protein